MILGPIIKNGLRKHWLSMRKISDIPSAIPREFWYQYTGLVDQTHNQKNVY